MPGRLKKLSNETNFVPVDFPFPMLANFSPPSFKINGMQANVSTLLTTVGLLNSPTWAGYGGRTLTSGR